MPVITSKQWDEFNSQFDDVHILQSRAWGEFKSKFGWYPVHLVAEKAGAQILMRRGPFGFRFAYIPRGPIGNDWNSLWSEIHHFCKSQNAIFLKVEPEFWESHFDAQRDSNGKIMLEGFRESPYCIQPRRTILLDISKPVDTLLGGMKQKTRYNIKLAERRGVIVRESTEVNEFYKLLKFTGDRDKFGIHSFDYYQHAFSVFSAIDQCRLFLAEYEMETIAGIMVFTNQNRAWYFYGASSDKHRDLMPNYLLQWEAILWAKDRGCKIYDFWGIPDEPENILEASYLSRKDGLWGVYRFKRGFGGEISRTIGSFEWVYSPILYSIYKYYLKVTGKKGNDKVVE